ncbi:MAG: hypothetical protein NT131_06810 [Methanomassiliicoccales archaeon]|nr:hypothetical protein [Methanomassiliicoccales archaeon]
MKVVAVITEDFRFFYGAVRLLKEKGHPFISMGFDDPLPLNVELVLTTEAERKRLRGKRVIASDDPERAVKTALALMQGGSYNRVIVGVDPGPRPGVAFLGDGKALHSDTVLSPEEVGPAVQDFLSLISTNELLVRVGHGDRTNRDRVINSLWAITRNIEMVDETSTTRRTGSPDADAAMAISKMRGELIPFKPQVEPTPGELREIQRLSRIHSDGAVTISSALAGDVARGALGLEEAIKKQKGKGVSEGHARE